MVEIDRYAMILARQLQERLAGDFLPALCLSLCRERHRGFYSEDLGAFYLDILKDRLYTTRSTAATPAAAPATALPITRSLVFTGCV